MRREAQGIGCDGMERGSGGVGQSAGGMEAGWDGVEVGWDGVWCGGVGDCAELTGWLRWGLFG